MAKKRKAARLKPKRVKAWLKRHPRFIVRNRKLFDKHLGGAPSHQDTIEPVACDAVVQTPGDNATSSRADTAAQSTQGPVDAVEKRSTPSATVHAMTDAQKTAPLGENHAVDQAGVDEMAGTDVELHADLPELPELATAREEIMVPKKATLFSLEKSGLERLRQQNNQLRQERDDLIERVRRNEHIYRLFRFIQTRLAMATDPVEMILMITREIEKTFDLSRVTVVLRKPTDLSNKSGETPWPRAIPEALRGRLFYMESRELDRTLNGGKRPVIRIGLEGTNREALFGETDHTIRSEVLIPLNPNPMVAGRPLMGSLNLGGAMPTRFLPSQSTDLLQELGDILAICLDREGDAWSSEAVLSPLPKMAAS